MKGFYTILLSYEDCGRFESMLNMLRISLNDWDKTKTFDYNSTKIVNYTILCTEDVFNTISHQIKAWYVY